MAGADPKKPKEAQLDSLEKLIKYLKRKYMDPKYKVDDIAGHRNVYVKKQQIVREIYFMKV